MEGRGIACRHREDQSDFAAWDGRLDLRDAKSDRLVEGQGGRIVGPDEGDQAAIALLAGAGQGGPRQGATDAAAMAVQAHEGADRAGAVGQGQDVLDADDRAGLHRCQVDGPGRQAVDEGALLVGRETLVHGGQPAGPDDGVQQGDDGFGIAARDPADDHGGGPAPMAARNRRRLSRTWLSTSPCGSKLHHSSEPCHCVASSRPMPGAPALPIRRGRSGEAVVQQAAQRHLPVCTTRPQRRVAQVLAQDQQPLGIGFDVAIVARQGGQQLDRAGGRPRHGSTDARGLVVQLVPGALQSRPDQQRLGAEALHQGRGRQARRTRHRGEGERLRAGRVHQPQGGLQHVAVGENLGAWHVVSLI